MFNTTNHLKNCAYIVLIYKKYKVSEEISDAHIVKNEFPKHFIFIKYRQWMNIKGTKIKKEIFEEVQQLIDNNNNLGYSNKTV